MNTGGTGTRMADYLIAVPLVGTLDSARTQLVTEKLLQVHRQRRGACG